MVVVSLFIFSLKNIILFKEISQPLFLYHFSQSFLEFTQYSTILTVIDSTQVIAAGIEESNSAVSEVNRTVAHLQERTDGLKTLVSRFNV